MAKLTASHLRPKASNTKVRTTSFKHRTNPPALANGFAISILNDDVVVFSFADVDGETENVFSSIALSKKAAVNFLHNLADSLEMEVNDEPQS